MIALMGLTSYSTSQANPDGVSLAGRFLPPANHSSLISTAASPATTFEMQGQAASFMASLGTFVQVSNSDLMQQVIPVQVTAERNVSATSSAKVSAKKSRVDKKSKLQHLGRKNQ